MSHLVRAWRLRLPNGLPQDPAPAAQPVTFTTSCPASQNRRFMLLLDRSGSVPLHQFFYIKNNRAGYFYTTNQSEGFNLGFTYQGVAGHVHNTNPLVPAAP